jgi:F-type H+-transporting ATPase subunit b
MDLLSLDTRLVYTITTIFYIAILFLFFWRRQKKQDKQLTEFLEEAKRQLELHKKEAQSQAYQKVHKAFDLIKRLQRIAENLEEQAKEEYEQILNDAKAEKKEIIADARKAALEISQSAEKELEEYKQKRKSEIEKNLVKLVMSVTEKVVERSLDYETHVDLINDAIEEVGQQKERL